MTSATINGNSPASFIAEAMARDAARRTDPAESAPGAAPNWGQYAIPHVLSFQSIFGSIAKVYRPTDEALKNSLDNSRFMRNDCGIMECIEARQRAVALLDWHLEPEDETSADQKDLCDKLTKILSRIKRFTDYRYNLLHALWYGRYGIQHQYRWTSIGGQMRLLPFPDEQECDGAGWLPINGDKLVFRYDDGRYLQSDGTAFPGQVGIRVGGQWKPTDKINDRWTVEYTDRGMAYFLAPWERKLVAIHKHMIEDGAFEAGLDAGMIHGVGIRSRIYWDWFQKQEALAFLMEYLERSAGGIELWYYDEGNPESKRQTEEAATQRIGNKRNVILVPRPRGDDAMAYGVQVVEPGMAGIESLKDILTNYFGHRIKRYILGQVLTSEAEATGLGSGVADAHLDTLMMIIRYDARGLDETITDQLVRHVKDWNFPHAKGIHIRYKTETEAPDLEKKLDGWQRAYEMGCKLKERDVMDLIGAESPGPDDRVLQHPQFTQVPGMGGPGGAPGDPSGGPGRGGPGAGPVDPGGGLHPTTVAVAAKASEETARALFGEGNRSETEHYAKTADEAAAETEQNPSDEQKASGNYRKGKFRLHGLSIAIETPKGAERRGKNRDGQAWSVTMPVHYGYILRTEGRDGDHVDCFVGPNPESEIVYVVDQTTPGGRFDEHKCLIGFTTEEDAVGAYLASYSDDAVQRVRDVTAMTVDQFKAWLGAGDTREPVAEQVSRYERSWNEADHPRGQPDNAGQFAEKEGSSERGKRQREKYPVKFSDEVIVGEGVPWGRGNLEEIEARMTESESQEFAHALENARDSWVDEQMSEYDPFDYIDWDEEFGPEFEDEEGYADDTLPEVRARMKELTDERREQLESLYDDSEDRIDYLRQFYENNEPRFADGYSSLDTWGKDADGGDVFGFETSSGAEYTVWKNDESEAATKVLGRTIPEFGFNDSSGSFGITGAGNAREVFSRATDAITEFVRRDETPAIYFSAAEPSRQKLYDRIVKSVAHDLPEYDAFAATTPDGKRHYVVAARDVAGELLGLAASKGVEPSVLVGRYSRSEADRIRWEPIEPESNPAWFDDDQEWSDFEPSTEAEPFRYELTPAELQKTRGESTDTAPKKSSRGGKGGKWVKLGGGAPAFVGPDGTIKKGCPGLKGENVDDLIDEPDESRDRRKARQAHAEASGLDGKEVSAKQLKSWEGKGAQQQHEAAARAAKYHDVPVADVLAVLPEALQVRMAEWERTEAARASARRSMGLNASNLGQIENAYRDYSSVPGFDDVAASIAMEFPEMGFGRTGDVAAEVWDFIREGSQPKPRLHDDETAEMAAQMLGRKSRDKATEPEAEPWGGDEWADAGGDDSFDPDKFARWLSAEVERYAAKKKSAEGQQEFRWVTIGGSAGEKGQHEGGTPVKIETATGRIVGGPKALADKGIQKLSDFGEKGGGESKESEMPTGDKSRPAWKMTSDEFANSQGAPKPHIDLFGDASRHQLAFMSERAKADRAKGIAEQRHKARKAYEAAIAKWESKIIDGLESGTLRLSEEFASDDFDSDTFSVVADRLAKSGIELPSPFKLRRADDREAILRDAEERFAALQKKEGEPTAKPEADSPKPTAAATPSPAAKKEPWEMMRDEFHKALNPKWSTSTGREETKAIVSETYRVMDAIRGHGGPSLNPLGEKISPERAEQARRRTIEGALAAGKSVPPEVLADYPDLKQQTGSVATPKPTVPGQQSSLFGGDDMKTGQKALFNVARPAAPSRKPATPDILASVTAEVRDILARKETISPADLAGTAKQAESLEGQKDLFARVRDTVEQYMKRTTI